MSESDRDLERLLGQASPRSAPPEDVRERAMAAAEREWQRYRRRRWRAPLAMAAALLLAAAAGVLVTGSARNTHVEVSETDGIWIDGILHEAPFAVDLAPDTTVEARGTTRLVAGDSTEVRLRAGTRLAWSNPGEVALHQGAVYVNTHAAERLRVRTPMGVVTDVGTIFMVSLDGDSMEVAMREGAATIDTRFGDYQARASGRSGDVVTVGTERVVADREPASAERWQWIHQVHPGYSERGVARLLELIAGDLGLTLEFDDPTTARLAEAGRLEADLPDLTPQEALRVVLGTAGLVRVPSTGDRLVVGMQPGTEHL